jgi:hypothetical protein
MIIVKWRNMTKKITIALVLGSLLGILIIIATVPGISKSYKFSSKDWARKIFRLKKRI